MSREWRSVSIWCRDCKGVRIISEESEKYGKRLKKGEKRGKKKMFSVSAVYTIDRNQRTVDDIIEELLEAEQAVKEKINIIVSAQLYIEKVIEIYLKVNSDPHKFYCDK